MFRPWYVRPGDAGRLVFQDDNRMRHLRAFLGDPRVAVACVGAEEVTVRHAEEWGLRLARPVDLNNLVAHAHGGRPRWRSAGSGGSGR